MNRDELFNILWKFKFGDEHKFEPQFLLVMTEEERFNFAEVADQILELHDKAVKYPFMGDDKEKVNRIFKKESNR